MTALFIIVLLLYLLFYWINVLSEKEYARALSAAGIYIMGITIGLLIFLHYPPEFNSKKYTLDTEIRQEIVDGRAMNSDTVYIITYYKPDK